MPDRAQHRNAIWAVFWAVAGILVVQIIYPPTHTLPLAYWQGQHQGYSSELVVAADIAKAFDDTTMRLTAGGKSVDVGLGALGAEPQVASVVTDLTAYPFWQRYVPLSILWPRFVDATTLTYANAISQPECQLRAAELSYDAVNASVQLKDGQLVATDDIDGAHVNADELCRQIQQTPIRLGQVVELQVAAQTIVAEQTSADFAVVAQQARTALDRPITFAYEQQKYTPEPVERAQWLRLDSDEAGQTALGVNHDALHTYLSGLSEQIGHPAGQTNITIVNGIETGRDTGEPGREVEYEPIIAAVSEQLLARL